MGGNRNMLGLVFSEVDVRLVDCVFSAKGDYLIRNWASFSRLEKNDIALGMALKSCLAEKNIHEKNVAIVLPDTDFLVKTLSLPKLSRKDTRKYLDREVSKGLELPIKDCLYDFFVSSDRENSGAGKVELSYLAASREHILRYAGIVLDAGLIPILMVPASMAMFHLMRLNAPPVSGPFALIYLGANRTTIAIAKGDHLVFSRRLNLSPFEDSFSEAAGDVSRAGFEDAIREIKRTLLYCKKDVVGQEVVRIIIAAAQPLPEQALDLLRAKLDLEVLPWHLNAPELLGESSSEDPVDAREKIPSSYLFALGGGACTARGTPLQLLPLSLKWKRYEKRCFRMAALLLLFFLIGGLWSYVVQKERLEEMISLASHRKTQVALAEAARREAALRAAKRHEKETRQAILSRLKARRPDFQAIFQALSQKMPKDARFDAVLIQQEQGRWKASLSGRTFWKHDIEQVEVFAALAAELEQSGQFSALAFQPVESLPELSGEGMLFQLRTYVR